MAGNSTTLISEAYSGRNIGDGELVHATISVARQRHPASSLVVVALDPSSFMDSPDAVFVGRLFDRRTFNAASRVGRLAWLARWAGFIGWESIRSFGQSRTKSTLSQWLIGQKAQSTYTAYLRADSQIAVGGGYLGDRYIKESALTLWTWWWSVRRGVGFESMPISIEAQTSPMRWFLRVLSPRTGIVVRDAASADVMTDLGIRVTRAPDLAFRHLVEGPSHEMGDECWIFPVGSDYLDEDDWVERWSVVAKKCLRRFSSVKVCSMHTDIDGLVAGGDGRVAEYLVSQFPRVERVRVESYSGLVSEIQENARVVVTARMHASIAAFCSGTPVVMLGYEEKHRALMRALGFDSEYLSVFDFTGDQLDQALDNAGSRSRSVVLGRVAEYVRSPNLECSA